MDSFSFGNLQVEKANAILKQRQLRKIANLFRFLEVCVVLILVSRLSFQLPVAFKNSSEYFKDFSVFVGSPCFVFVIGNVIIITLFAQSGQFSALGSKSKSPVSDHYQQLIQNSTKNQRIEKDQNMYPEKQSIITEDAIMNQKIDGNQIKNQENQSIETEDTRKGQIIDEEQIKYLEKQNWEWKPSIRGENNRKNQKIEGGQIKCLEKQSIKTEDRIQRQIIGEEHIKYPEKKKWNWKLSIRKEDSMKKQRIEGGQIKCVEKQSMKTEDHLKGRIIDQEQLKYSEKKRWTWKPRIRTDDTMKNQRIDGGQIKCTEKQSIKTGETKCLEVKDYRRSQTEKINYVHNEKPRSLLLRSETENRRISKKVAETSFPEDGMSNEEFRCTVEAFIARQQKHRREEEYSVV